MKFILVLCLLSSLIINIAIGAIGSLAHANEAVVWERNANTPFFAESLENIIKLTTPQYGELTLITSSEMEQGRAFSELVEGRLDIFIAAPSKQKEASARPIYVPLDRGLLGFRVCLTQKNSEPLATVNSAQDFKSKGLKIGLGSHWPDTQIYQQNGFEVVTSPIYESLFPMLRRKRFDCFSRSVNELDKEIQLIEQHNLQIDKNIVFIYPNADFIFVAPQNEALHTRLSIGMGMAIEDGSYFDIFDKHFGSTLIKHGIYERKLLIMDNQQVSTQALSAINRFGIASFLVPVSNPIDVEPSD